MTVQAPVQVITKKVVAGNNALQIDYPVIIGMTNSIIQHKINNRILALVNSLVKDSGYYSQANTTVQVWYELKTNERGILSLSIIMYYYAYQAAHGMTIVKSLTFDIKTGRTYKLSSLFKPDSNYVKVLSDIISLQIKVREIPLLDDFKGIDPEQDYYIADKSLVVYFQLYEITPYVYGLPYFPISVYELQDIIRDEGALGRMANS